MNKEYQPDTMEEQAEEIFYSALDVEDPQERTTFITNACGGDAALRGKVERLLAGHSGAEAFFSADMPTRISAVEISETLADIPDFFENMRSVLPDDDEVGKQIGNYKLLQKIGEGGGGTVYLAEQVKPVRRQVAFKIIKLGMDTRSVIARFEAERQALAMMEHPNIAHVLNAGQTETGRPFFVMELVDGVRITTYCQEKRLNIEQRLELFIQVCHAIQHAHLKGIIHRDIKPSNVIITQVDGAAAPKVIDFGIAKATKGDLLTGETMHTAQEPFIGTPAYMSPEQADYAHTDIDMRSDIYSLGTLLYELLAGCPPFDQKELMKAGIDEMRRTLREVDPPRPSKKLLSFPDEKVAAFAAGCRIEPRRLIALLGSELDWIVMKALEKDRDRRYQTADGFAADVQRCLHHEPVLARPPSRRYRFRKLVRRNKGVFVSAGAVSLALVLGLGCSSWLLVRERALREAVEIARRNEAALRQEAEAREKIAQAAVLLKRNKVAEADALVGNVEIPVVKPSLEARDVFTQLAGWNAIQGRWEEARDRSLKLALAMQVDDSDMTDSATRDLLRVAPTIMASGDVENYRRLIRSTVDHFGGARNPVAAEQVIKISILMPMDEELLKTMEPLSIVVEDSMIRTTPSTQKEIYYYAWRAFALAWFKYRQGDYTGAVQWGEKCLAYKDSTPTRIAMAHTLLAAAHGRLGEFAEARFELALSHAIVDPRFPAGLSAISALGNEKTGFWHDWVMAYVLLRETDGLFVGSK